MSTFLTVQRSTLKTILNDRNAGSLRRTSIVDIL